MTRILCPVHKEHTPSCVLYEDSWHCFGCGARGSLSELGLAAPPPRPKENLVERMREIDQMPLVSIRGLTLPSDGVGYYIKWPDNTYYKKRLRIGGANKYLCPAGHTKPLLVAVRAPLSSPLFVVEGELNALSLALLAPGTVVSPGGAADFSSKKYLQEFKKYNIIYIIADNDRAGYEAVVKLKAECLKYTHKVYAHLMERDFNDILVERGLAGVADEYEKIIRRG